MTELQMGLVGLGVTAVVGVLAYNKWQEYRQRKLGEAAFKPQQQDALFNPVTKDDTPAAPIIERQEPVIGRDGAAVETAAPGGNPFNDHDGSTGAHAEDAEAGEVPAILLDPRLEFIVGMELVDPVPAEQLLAAQRALAPRLNKPAHWVGFNEKTRDWALLSAANDQVVRRLRVGLQLVDRRGPLSEADLLIFKNAMQSLADELMAVATMPQFPVLEQAAELDRFCASVDLEIGINLISRGGLFPGTKIRALAEAAGMELSSDGAFIRRDDNGRTQFSLQNYESTAFSNESLRGMTTHGLTFAVDVPHVEHGERLFAQMTEIANRFADTLQGTLVDDNCQPLSAAQLDHIRREFIGRTQSKMAAFGLPAGSPQALRLFS